jgi:formate hydrogenlyase subunit 3/multisubunit Na+/H+ antiporter MnhD subunit
LLNDIKIRSSTFVAFFLLACSGNLLLILAGDLVSFYVGFALMGLSAAGMVFQQRSQTARRAGRLYLIWTLVGEMALFVAVAWLVAQHGNQSFIGLLDSTPPAGAVALLIFGFGIKVALPGLHFWLPLTYSAASPVTTALLSGPMISAGVLGWLRFLPADGNYPPLAGETLITLGVIGVALGTFTGLLQRHPAAVLGYSSVSKMGLVSTLFGMALVRPDASNLIAGAIVVFVMHHMMLKTAFFLGLAEWRRVGAAHWLIVTFVLLSLAIIGFPFTAGAASKVQMAEATLSAGYSAGLLLGFSSLGTLLLMARLLWVLSRRPMRQGLAMPSSVWLFLCVLALMLPFGLHPTALHVTGLVTLLLGSLLIFGALWWSRRPSARAPYVPRGDLMFAINRWPAGAKQPAALRRVELSPIALLSADDIPFNARILGVLFWLLLLVAASSYLIMPSG